MSKQDLITLAKNDYKSVYAVGSHYTYSVTKGTHFKKDAFTKALNKAKASTTNYNTSVDKWLRDNQKKYGYVYKRERTKTKK